MGHGRHGRYLRIDLSTGVATPVLIPDEVFVRYLGGVGLGTWICLREGGAEHRPLAARAPLVICLSPLVGTPLTTSAKLALVARSPLTGLLSDGLSSSHFAIAAKRAGFDAYVIVGRARALSRIVIDDGRVTFEDARELSGFAAADCERPGFHTAAIGPAGERMVRFATISNDGRHAGRGGLGAVLGAKRVKAITVRGSGSVSLADPQRVLAIAADLSRRSLEPATAKYRELGTIANVLVFNRMRTLPSHNFRDSEFAGASEISAEAFHRMPGSTRRSCAACTIGCEHVFPAAGGETRLEYESLYALGPLLGIDDRDAILAASRRCDDLGLDTISAGGTLALAMEVGLEGLRFGDPSGVVAALERIAAGGPLGQGSRRVAESIGRPELAMHVKGLEMPGYDPRRLPAMALGLAVCTRGADHNRSSAYELDFSSEDFEVGRVIELENRAAAIDSLILCKFLRSVFGDFAAETEELVEAVTGERIDMLELGARVCTLRRLFNERCGWSRDLDTLPDRLFGDRLDREWLDTTIERYYEARCWTSQGQVPESLLEQLQICV